MRNLRAWVRGTLWENPMHRLLLAFALWGVCYMMAASHPIAADLSASGIAASFKVLARL